MSYFRVNDPARLRLGPPSLSPADLVFPLTLGESGQAYAGTCGHDRPTAATRCAEARSTMQPVVPLQSGWSGRCLQGCGAGLHDATPLQNSGQVSKSKQPSVATLRPGLRPEGVAPPGQHNIAICHRRPPFTRAVGISAGHALWSQLGRGSASATVLTRSPYPCSLQRQAWAPYIVRNGPGSAPAT